MSKIHQLRFHQVDKNIKKVSHLFPLDNDDYIVSRRTLQYLMSLRIPFYNRRYKMELSPSLLKVMKNILVDSFFPTNSEVLKGYDYH
ncbi:MAG: hypothetical protein A3I05_06360 [Deltaproteobacteria bacterium RIFCSPLOWO2_02_FULL_44_10]|nr:MAG: hypothetical protein A3C46_01645 [Deltaproteobacteria bacterium RIFCSPHIGHO2_02_FULL_44_16]OGQ46438.1 MAG: hypothetical protein A3I05_06360 [Deltaproteobacteria bacterium RIFCSPLOWO2_02_FULL_44_10]